MTLTLVIFIGILNYLKISHYSRVNDSVRVIEKWSVMLNFVTILYLEKVKTLHLTLYRYKKFFYYFGRVMSN